VGFRDGVGERRQILDPTGSDTLEVLSLRSELSSVPSFEFALRERLGRLANFRHAFYGRVRSVERLTDPASTLAIISEHTQGIRLSEILVRAEERRLGVDINTALCLIRQLVPAVAMLHEHARDVAHGAIGPERLVLTPGGRLVIVEHVMGSAIEQLRFAPERYWSELRVAIPAASGTRLDHRTDVTQIGTVALSLILGRVLRDEEYPSRIADLVASTWAVSARGGFEPLPPGLRGWLGRALQLDPSNGFSSAIEARGDLEKVLGNADYLASPASLEAFLARYQAAISAPAPPGRVAPPPPPARPTPVAPAPVPIQSARPLSSAPAPPGPFGASSRPPVANEQASAASAQHETLAQLDARFPQDSETMSEPAPAPGASTSSPQAASPSTLGLSSAGSSLSTPVATTKPSSSSFPFLADAPAEAAPTGGTSAGGGWMRWAAAVGVLIALVAGGVYAGRVFFSETAPDVTSGTLAVTTEPAGAQVIVDGEPRGVTPVTLTLPPGPHRVELVGEGEPRSIPVTITAGMQVSQYVELARTGTVKGQLQVRTEPAGARVTIDGEVRGTSPTTVADLSPGEHVVVLDGPHGSLKQIVNIEAGATASLVVPLAGAAAAADAPVSGWLAVSAPIELQIFEGSKLLGSSLSERIMVGAGRHELEMVNEALGYRASRVVQVGAGKVSSVAVETPEGVLALNALPWAEVWVDGERAGETPLGNLRLPIGRHSILFRHPELGEQHHTVTVTLKDVARLSVDLRKR
jgi:serine/threonine protein kinase